MNIEEVLSTTHRISPRERVPFHCTCCGECCRHVRQSVPLESPDVFRLTRLLREKDKGIICMDDFIARYTELALLDECGYFMLMLKVTGVDDACIFLKENRCICSHMFLQRKATAQTQTANIKSAKMLTRRISFVLLITVSITLQFPLSGNGVSKYAVQRGSQAGQELP